MPTNYPVVGVIDGKFEHGYLVTVMVGTEKLRGVLYHTSGFMAANLQQNLVLSNNAGGGRRRRRRKKLSTLDPTHPKPNRSGYNFFFAEQHARLKPMYPGKDREISKIIGDLWSKLTESEKSVIPVKFFSLLIYILNCFFPLLNFLDVGLPGERGEGQREVQKRDGCV